MECPKSMTAAAMHICSNCTGKAGDEKMQAFAKDAQRVIDYIGAIGENLEKMGIKGKEFDDIMKSVDPKAFESVKENPDTEEGLAKIMNKLIFRGDWQKQLEWTEKHGTQGDVEVVRRGMGRG